MPGLVRGICVSWWKYQNKSWGQEESVYLITSYSNYTITGLRQCFQSDTLQLPYTLITPLPALGSVSKAIIHGFSYLLFQLHCCWLWEGLRKWRALLWNMLANQPAQLSCLLMSLFFIYIYRISVIFAMRAVGAAVSFLGRLCLVTEMANTRFPRKAKGYPCVR